jgi:hypothetical protein
VKRTWATRHVLNPAGTTGNHWYRGAAPPARHPLIPRTFLALPGRSRLKIVVSPVRVRVSPLALFPAQRNPSKRVALPEPRLLGVEGGGQHAHRSVLQALREIKFNAVERGFTATDLTAAVGGGQPVAEGAEVIVRMATIGKDGPTGTFQETGGELAW